MSANQTAFGNVWSDPWCGPHGLPDFAALDDADLPAALDAALAAARAEVRAIAADPAPANFANVIARLELSGDTLTRVAGLFFPLVATESNPARLAFQVEAATKLAEFSSDLAMEPALYERVRQVAQSAALSTEERQVAEKYERTYRLEGGALGAEGRAKMRANSARRAQIQTAFSQNLLADERDWMMPLTPAQTEGLSPALLSGAAEAARDRGLEGHVITLSRSLAIPFLEQSPDRAARQHLFEAFNGRGALDAARDNRPLIRELLQLRAEAAQLLGYGSYTEAKLDGQMARDAEDVRALLTRVWGPATEAATREAAALEALMREDGINDRLAGWDWRYYAARFMEREHALDETEIAPYFSLDAMRRAAFECAGRLFGLSFAPIDVPLYHPDAQAWEARKGERHMGVLITDYFARPSKRSGAWCGAPRKQSRAGGRDIRPIVTNVCNFTKPAAGAPALLSFDEAETLFHEFGHALHHLLSDVTWPGISGTSVARDFVELPSQLFEHWLSSDMVLRDHARHVETGAPLPDDLRARILAARTAGAGYASLEYLASALVDLELHAGSPPADPMQAQADILAGMGLSAAIPMRHGGPHFQHIFAGDSYSSQYYCYMWAEVLDADAFTAFEEAGDPFDAEVARRLHDHIYSAGGATPPQALYAAYRGAEPDPDAFMRRRGLLPA